MDKDSFYASLSTLKLDQGWFAEIPRDLLYLACLRDPSKYISNLFMDKYGTSDNETLEFYGDKVLHIIGGIMIFQLYGLNTTPGQATRIYDSFANNKSLLAFTEHENFCQNLIKSINCKYTRPTSLHNICSDSFEAIIGAIYLYGLSISYDLVLDEIYAWFISFDYVPELLSKLLNMEINKVIEFLNPEYRITWDMEIDIEDPRLWKTCPPKKSRSKNKSPFKLELQKGISLGEYLP